MADELTIGACALATILWFHLPALKLRTSGGELCRPVRQQSAVLATTPARSLVCALRKYAMWKWCVSVGPDLTPCGSDGNSAVDLMVGLWAKGAMVSLCYWPTLVGLENLP